MAKQALQSSNNQHYSNHFDEEAWFRVTDIDYKHLIEDIDWAESIFNRYQSRPIELLDVGCGTGQFPTMLRKHLNCQLQINYHCVDPVENCLKETKAKLIGPYNPGIMSNQTIQEFLSSPHNDIQYDVIWSIHSLYLVPQGDLTYVLRKLFQLLGATGIGLFYISNKASFYNQFYETFVKEHMPGSQVYLSAEKFEEALEHLNCDVTKKVLNSKHEIALEDNLTLERYLSKNSFQNKDMREWSRMGATWDLIKSYEQETSYIFPQEVTYFIVRPN